MKLARTLLSVLALSILAACGESITAPQAQPDAEPSQTTICKEVLVDGAVVLRCGSQLGSGG